MNILICGGGTAGHINPALAIAKKLQSEMPDAKIAFVGTPKGLENRLVAGEGFSLYHIKVMGFARRLTLKNIGAAYYALKSPHDAAKILRDFAPNLVIGTGGYVSWPVLRAAAKRKIPTAIHEQNALPGMTTRLLAKLVNLVFVSYEGSRKYLECDPKKIVFTGNPLRPELRTVRRESARRQLKIDGKFILAFGGSLGAAHVNEALYDFEETVSSSDGICMTHALGSRAWAADREILREKGLTQKPFLTLTEYIDNMPTLMAAADLVICRAGALTLAELSYLGTPAILIPSPYVADNHQFKNAAVFRDAGAALLIEEKDLASGALVSAIRDLLSDRVKLMSMRRTMARFAVRDADERIYAALTTLMR